MPRLADRHLVAVWNPAYALTALDEHLRVLRDWTRKADAEQADDDELYVWWGKVKSSNRQAPMAHLDEVRATAEAARDDELEVQLYLTDYRALYVAELLDVCGAELPAGEEAHVPAYYRENRLSCDLWFKLGDIRRLVADDTVLVVEELKRLANVHYNDRPVSLYGGMVNLPLVVKRSDGRHYFAEEERTALTDGALWVEHDAESGAGIGAMERELRENRFGDVLWSALEPAARTFIATSERMFRDHRGDASYDFAPVLNGFAKAIEVQANSVLRSAMPRLKPAERLAKLDGRTVDLSEHGMLGLGELARAIGGEERLAGALASVLHEGAWFSGSFPSIADALRDVRNPGSHSAVIDVATASKWRAQLLGVGCAGELVTLARVRVR